MCLELLADPLPPLYWFYAKSRFFKSFFIPLPHRKLRSHRVRHAFQSLERREIPAIIGESNPFRGALKIFQCVVNIPRSPSRSNALFQPCVQILILSQCLECVESWNNIGTTIWKVCESMNLESLLIDRAESQSNGKVTSFNLDNWLCCRCIDRFQSVKFLVKFVYA